MTDREPAVGRERLVAALRADLAKAEQTVAGTKCEACDAVIFDDEDACHTGDVAGCWPFVLGVPGGDCWRYRTEKGMDRAWPACPLATAALSGAGTGGANHG